jgi:outer membrane receptor protein involved in Fe transport
MPVVQLPTPPPVVVVRAANLPPAPGDAAFSIVVIDPMRLRRSERLDEALTSVPGVALFRRTSSLGANPTTQGISVRGIAGSAASRALVTVDGVPQNDPFGGWVIWTGLPPEAISAASVVRGAGAGPYGAGALTGAIALDSPTRIDGGAIADIDGGDFGYGRAAGAAEIDTGSGRLFLDASGEHSSGWIPVIQGRGAVDQPLRLGDESASERFVTDVGEAVLTERIAGYAEDRDAGTLFAGSHDQGGQASLGLTRQPSDGQLGWRIQAWVSGSNLANTSASVAASRNTATLADNQYATPAIGLGFNAAVREQSVGGSWELGADLRDFDGASRDQLFALGKPTGFRTAGGGEAIGGVYAEGSRAFGPLLLTGGVRLDAWEDYDSSLVQTGQSRLVQNPPDRGGVVPTGRIGLRRDVTRGLYVRAAAYAGFRPATLNELHRMFRVGNDVTEANPALAPERLYGVEAGIGGTAPLAWDADVFANRIVDPVTNVTIGKGPATFPLAGFVPAGGTLFERENAGAINAFGFEADAAWPLTPGVDLDAAFAYTHARVDGGSQAPQLTGLRPAETPETVATAGVVWSTTPRLTLTGAVRYQGGEFDDDLNTRKIDGGTEVDLRADWRLTARATAFVAADNLFDDRLQSGRSATGVITYAAPRMVRVGLALRFEPRPLP